MRLFPVASWKSSFSCLGIDEKLNSWSTFSSFKFHLSNRNSRTLEAETVSLTKELVPAVHRLVVLSANLAYVPSVSFFWTGIRLPELNRQLQLISSLIWFITRPLGFLERKHRGPHFDINTPLIWQRSKAKELRIDDIFTAAYNMLDLQYEFHLIK